MSTSPWVEVIEPPELREEIKKRLREAGALYRTGQHQKKARPKAMTARAAG